MSQKQLIAPGSQLFIDMEGLRKDMEQVDLHLALESIPEKVILLLGETKAGKTTLMYYLLGKKLIREKDEEMGLYYMKPQAKIFDAALIGNNYDSTTVYPNIPTELGQDNVLIIDMPGFSDTRFGYRLLNIYIIREVIKKIKSVHVSLVISNEFIEANSLIGIVERNCMLLNRQLLGTPGCFSFILTKIEDKEAEMEQFEESLKQLEEEGGILQEINTLTHAKVYTFLNDSPKVEEGVELKRKIISENKFFLTNELPENLLSQEYADVILGEDIQEDFYDFIFELLEGLESILPNLISLFSNVVKYHHGQELKGLFLLSEVDNLPDKIFQYSSELTVSDLSTLRISYDQLHEKPEPAISYLNLAKKYYRVGMHLKNDPIEDMLVNLQNFIEWSRLLASEESMMSKQLRENMHKVFKFCSSSLKTITNIRSRQITERCEGFCSSKYIEAAISQYNQYVNSDLLTRIAHSDIGTQYLCHNEEFKEILLSFFPSFEFEEGEEVIERVSVWGKIKHKKISAALAETMKDTSKPVQKEERFVNVNITEMSKDMIGTIRNMPIGSQFLRNLLKVAFKFQADLTQTKEPVKIEFGIALLRKIALILLKLGMLEIAVLFYLTVPSELEAEEVINSAICFRQLSKEFIECVLLPYYSQWSPNFEMVQRLYNYLSLHLQDYSSILQNEIRMVDTLQKMHQINYDQLPTLRRFEYAMIDTFKLQDNQLKILEQAELAEQSFNASKMTYLKDELQSLRIS